MVIPLLGRQIIEMFSEERGFTIIFIALVVGSYLRCLVNDFLLHRTARRKSEMGLNMIDLGDHLELGSRQVLHKARVEFTSSHSVLKPSTILTAFRETLKQVCIAADSIWNSSSH
jgi:hypothetical protein